LYQLLNLGITLLKSSLSYVPSERKLAGLSRFFLMHILQSRLQALVGSTCRVIYRNRLDHFIKLPFRMRSGQGARICSGVHAEISTKALLYGRALVTLIPLTKSRKMLTAGQALAFLKLKRPLIRPRKFQARAPKIPIEGRI
jgi:hypothetical protein